MIMQPSSSSSSSSEEVDDCPSELVSSSLDTLSGILERLAGNIYVGSRSPCQQQT